ncbi:hypothetical protein THRCLA_21732 [Thraustotheca clavata]|uniref:Secreted protein n=1 Tax=Thraustotheca clavata TaxID=74557 RepID=A0A1V9ZQ93_9STRA|nr:hypothetical protein THRCLA_21732 [Thraustotheca clavata]
MARWLMIAMSLAAIATISEAKGNRYARVDRKWKMQKKYCTERDCSLLDKYTNMNCVNMCLSPTCYERVYAEEPLEDGEVDDYRSYRFVSCLRKEFLKPRAKDEL